MTEPISLKPEIWYHPITGEKIYFYSIIQLEEMRHVARMNDAHERLKDKNSWNGWKPVSRI